MSSKLPSQRCPECDKKLDAATDTLKEERAPEPGDLTICLYCQTPLEFGPGMIVKRLDLQELADRGPEGAEAARYVMTVIQRIRQHRHMIP